jgi:L-iditol 2-dehydrogenase
MIVPPAVFGHELSGVISEVCAAPSDGRSESQVGDRVVVANSAPCGECVYCRNHQENLCDDLLFLNGAYAQSIVVPARIVQKNLLHLKPGTEFRDAALVEPLACVVQGVEETGMRSGQHILVLGAGPIGLMFVALAKEIGCRVTVAGRGAPRLKTARKLGAHQVIDVGDAGNLVAHIRDGASDPFDVVIEAVGKPETWEAAVQLVRKGGTVNFFGGCPSGSRITLDTTLIHYSNLLLRASFHHTPRTIRRALEFIEAGVIRSDDFVGGACALSKLPDLLAEMTRGNRVVKTLIDVNA